MEERPEDADLFIDKQQESEAAFWRIKKAMDDWRDNRIKRVMAQEGESIFRTLGRVLYIISCIIFDGLILIELPINITRNGSMLILVRLSLRILDWE
jgi:hypothetical protein